MCSPTEVFQRLKLDVKADAEARTRYLLDHNGTYGFTAISNGRSISVFIQGGGVTPGPSVVFTQTEDGISVHDEADNLIFDATLTLSDKGECRLKVDGLELESWQFRKLALEDLFFSNPWVKEKR